MEPLFEYQREGVDWLKGRSLGLLADEMGLGKSAQTIAAADAVGAKRILVICPAVARVNWDREFKRWSPSPPPFSILFKLSDIPPPLSSAICSFDYAAENADLLGGGGRWDLLIIDEVHFLKSAFAKRTKKIFGRGGIVHSAKRTWILSGTPAPNGLASELWIIFYLFGVTKLKYDAFIEEFCHMFNGPRGPVVTGTKKEKISALKELLKKCMLRRKKMDVLKQLPPISFHDVTVEAGPVDLAIQASFAEYMYPTDNSAKLMKVIGEEEKALEAAVFLKATNNDRMKMMEGMAKSVATLRRYVGLQKVPAVVEMVKGELSLGLYEKIVIFAVHRDVIESLRRDLHVFGAVTLYGGTALETRQKNIDRFQKHPKCQVFIGNIAAAGTNITLTAAHQCLVVEADWVPGNNAQAVMRLHRIGQLEHVTVRFVSLSHPVDERVTEVLRRKTKDIMEIFDA